MRQLEHHSMKDTEVETPTQALLGGSFADWLEAVKDLEAGALDEPAFLGMLRPYYWFVHQPGFQDLYDACARASDILKARKDDLDDGYNYPGLLTFLVGYTENESLDSTGWIFMGGSAEIAASVGAGELASKLEELNAPAEEIAALQAVKTTMKRIEGGKHTAYNNLREIGDKHLDPMNAIIDTLHPSAQSFILHAMNGFKGDPAVIAFYEGFLERNADTPLKDEVAEYLASVR
jgi:hypothetical protein